MSLICTAEDWLSLRPIPDFLNEQAHTRTHTRTLTHTCTHTLGERVKPHGKENEVWPRMPLNTTPGEALAQDYQEMKDGRQRICEKEGSGSAELSLCTSAMTTQAPAVFHTGRGLERAENQIRLFTLKQHLPRWMQIVP